MKYEKILTDEIFHTTPEEKELLKRVFGSFNEDLVEEYTREKDNSIKLKISGHSWRLLVKSKKNLGGIAGFKVENCENGYIAYFGDSKVRVFKSFL